MQASTPSKGREPSPDASPPLVARLALAVLGGILTVLAFPRYGAEIGLDALIWVAPWPLIAAARGAGLRVGFLCGWLAGMTLEAGGFVWILFAIREFASLGPILSALAFLGWLLWTCVPWGLLGLALGGCRRPAHALLAVAAWVGVEHLFPRLFPWHLGGALYGRPWLLQCVDLVGASGLTALVLLVSTALYRVGLWGRRREPFPVVHAIGAAVVLVAANGYGAWRLDSLEALEASRPRHMVGLVQGRFDPREEPEGGERELDVYIRLSRELVESRRDIELLVWPEGVIDWPFVLAPDRVSPWALVPRDDPREQARRRALTGLGAPLVAGGGGVELVPGPGGKARLAGRYNVSAYLRPGEPPRFYRKNCRIPFGETVPLLDLLPPDWRRGLGLVHVGNLDAGTDNPAFPLGDHTFRNLVCYEAVLPGYVRRAARGVDFLVNITEDMWYGRTAHVPQHVSVLILRSVESRVPIVRATNVGPSGVVGITGRFDATDRVFERDVLVRPLTPARVDTIYERGGWTFPGLALLVGGLAWGIARRRGRRDRTPA